MAAPAASSCFLVYSQILPRWGGAGACHVQVHLSSHLGICHHPGSYGIVPGKHSMAGSNGRPSWLLGNGLVKRIFRNNVVYL